MQQATHIADVTAFFNTETDESGKRRVNLVEFSPTEQIFNRRLCERTIWLGNALSSDRRTRRPKSKELI
ncbi:hypothetical protein [Phormidesmis priestleyi]|uniref:hypothetical protein n=1 Tax=Phormidesmis priestleyi TaxID=268141 RepID=UPI0009343DA2|nr:hypothetical protein [Phormidesmis priestleyi]